MDSPLPSIAGDSEGLEVAQEVIKQTRRYREVANRRRTNQAVSVGQLVWVRKEVTLPGTSRKLNPKWAGPYKTIEVIRDGGAYLLENVFTRQKVQRAAEKIKPYLGKEEWLLASLKVSCAKDDNDEPMSPRLRNTPRRYIEEC